MPILTRLRRLLLLGWLSLLSVVLPATAHAAGEFVVLCYHEVEADSTANLTRTAVRASDLAQQFAWLQANGYHVVSLQQVLDAHSGGSALPEHAVLLTFDDGKHDVYTRVFPLLRLFRYPAVVALVGQWLDVPDGGTVDYDGTPMPRSEFVSWSEVREMQRSGLVEIASHTYGLHRGILANPQGNTQPAAITRAYAAGQYESDHTYLDRLRTDLRRNRDLIAQRTGSAPRAIVWPYGRSNGAAQDLATELGMVGGMTLEDGFNELQTPLPRIKRYLIEESPSLQSFAESLRHVWRPDPARSARVSPDAWPSTEAGLSHTLDVVQRLALNIVFVSPTHRADQADELNRIAWQIERRAGSPVFIDVPADWLNQPARLADLARYVNFAGVRLPVAPGNALAARALTEMERWRWPLRVAYAPAGPLPADAWSRLQPGDLVVLPGGPSLSDMPPVAQAHHVLFEFNPEQMPAQAIAEQMRQLESNGFRQFGVTRLPEADSNSSSPGPSTSGTPDAVGRALSLRSQPLLP